MGENNLVVGFLEIVKAPLCKCTIINRFLVILELHQTATECESFSKSYHALISFASLVELID